MLVLGKSKDNDMQREFESDVLRPRLVVTDRASLQTVSRAK